MAHSGSAATSVWGRAPYLDARPKESCHMRDHRCILFCRSSGCYSGTAKDSQDTLEFSALTGVHPMIEKYPLSRAAEAYEQMHSGKVRFRVVLTMNG